MSTKLMSVGALENEHIISVTNTRTRDRDNLVSVKAFTSGLPVEDNGGGFMRSVLSILDNKNLTDVSAYGANSLLTGSVGGAPGTASSVSFVDIETGKVKKTNKLVSGDAVTVSAMASHAASLALATQFNTMLLLDPRMDKHVGEYASSGSMSKTGKPLPDGRGFVAFDADKKAIVVGGPRVGETKVIPLRAFGGMSRMVDGIIDVIAFNSNIWVVVAATKLVTQPNLGNIDIKVGCITVVLLTADYTPISHYVVIGAAAVVIKSAVFVVHRAETACAREKVQLVCMATSLTGSATMLKWCLSDVEGGKMTPEDVFIVDKCRMEYIHSDDTMAQVGALGRIGNYAGIVEYVPKGRFGRGAQSHNYVGYLINGDIADDEDDDEDEDEDDEDTPVASCDKATYDESESEDDE
jgi:hypothetical protein